MSIGHILGGALQGIGAGLSMQAQQRAETEAAQAKETAAMRREIALEKLRAGNNQKLQQQQSDNRRAEMAAGAKLDDWKANEASKRGLSRDITMASVNAKVSQDLARLNSSLRMTEKQQEVAAEMFKEVYLSNTEVAQQKVDSTGALVFYNKAGKEISRSAPGQFTPDGGGADTPFPRSGVPAPGAGVAKPQAAPKPSQPKALPPLGSFYEDENAKRLAGTLNM